MAQTVEEFVNTVTKKIGKGWDFLDCDATLTEKLNVIYFGDDLTTDAFKFFEMVAKEHNHSLTYNFIQATSQCAQEHEAEDGQIVLLRSFDYASLVWDGGYEVESDGIPLNFLLWLKMREVPSLFEFSDEYVESILSNEQTTAVLFIKEKDNDIF